MSYTPSVPVSGQSLGSSRPIINSNFTVIQTVFDINHQDFNSSNPGCHNKVDLLAQGSVPTPPTNAVTLFNKLDGSLQPQLWLKRAGGTEIQMSKGNPLIATTGYTFLPGGLYFMWGQGGGAGTTTNIVFPVTLSAIYSVTVTPIIGNTTPVPISISGPSSGVGGNFNVYTTNSTTVFRWMAVGA